MFAPPRDLVLVAEALRLVFSWEDVNSISVSAHVIFQLGSRGRVSLTLVVHCTACRPTHNNFEQVAEAGTFDCNAPGIRISVEVGSGAATGDGGDDEDDAQSRVYWLRLPQSSAGLPQEQLAVLNRVEQALGTALRRSFGSPQQTHATMMDADDVDGCDEGAVGGDGAAQAEVYAMMMEDDEADEGEDGEGDDPQDQDLELYQQAVFWEPAPEDDPEWESRLADVWDSKLVEADGGGALLAGLLAADDAGAADFDDLPPLQPQ